MAQRLHGPSRSVKSTSRSRRHVPHSRKDKKFSPKKEQKPFKPQTKKNGIPNPLTGVISPSSSNEASDETGAAETDNDSDMAEDDDPPNLDTPSIVVKPSSSKKDSATWRGLTGEQQVADPEGVDSDTNMADGEDDFDVAEDDDDYGDVDGFSEASEDSAMFEAEVERAILEEGETAIDWDDQNIFGYTGPWQESQYFLQEMESSDTLFGADPLNLDFVESVQAAEPEPVLGHPVVEVHTRSWSPDINWSASGSSVSGETVRSGSESPSRKASQVSAAMSDLSAFSLRIDKGQETDEEELPTPTVSSPAVTLSRCNSTGTPTNVLSRVIDPSTPRRPGLSGPIKRKLKINPNKPIAYYVEGVKMMVFKTPKGSKLKWIDMRGFDRSIESSTPSSPTMIDLDAALREGNQRTGAAITDVIYGQMFRQYHCTHFELAVQAQPSAHAEFARVPLLNGSAPSGVFSSGNFDLLSDADHDMGDGTQSELALNELIDFDGGVEQDEPYTAVDQPIEQATPSSATFEAVEHEMPMPTTPTTPQRRLNKGKGRATNSGESHRDGISTLTTPEQQVTDPNSSPLKRRRSMSPSLKKKQRTTTTD